MPRPKDLYGTRGSLLRKLWKAVKKTSRLLDSDDPQVVLRATHALATIAASYRAAYAEWEAERARKAGEAATPKVKQIEPHVLWVIKRDIYGLDMPPPESGEPPSLPETSGTALTVEPLPPNEAALEGHPGPRRVEAEDDEA